MLLGEFSHNLDIKGRIAIPAKFREVLSGGAIITRGLDSCLFLFPLSEWQRLVERLMALPITQANSRAFVRLMLAGATDVLIDNQGRALIPDYLRVYAGLTKEAVVTGLHSRAEIWNASRWHDYKQKTEGASEQIAEQLKDLGI